MEHSVQLNPVFFLFDKTQMFSFSKSPNGGQEMYWGGWNGWFWPVAKLKNLNSRKRGGDYIRSKLTHMATGQGEGDVVMTFKLYFESAKCILFLYLSASKRWDFVNYYDQQIGISNC